MRRGRAEANDLRRFRTEAEAVARLQHRNIVQIHEVDEHDGRPYLVLEYVSGGSLDRHLAGGPLPARQAAQLAETLARAVHYAHEQGIIHRDLKPANVLLDGGGAEQGAGGSPPTPNPQPLIPKITDFGLAKLLHAGAAQTQTGAVLGTPSYMVPEQADGRKEDVGRPADVYALGAILYETLTGRPPFQGESPLDTLLLVRYKEPVPVTRLHPRVPRDLETVCLKCLAKDPSRRYPSAAELADDLRRFLAGKPVRARPVGALGQAWRWCRRHPAVAGLLAVLLVVFLTGFAGVALKWWEAEHEAGLKRAAVAESQENLARAEASLYLYGINLAHREWLANRVEAARQHLDDCPPGPRAWEWHYLRRLVHAAPVTPCAGTPSIQGLQAHEPPPHRLRSILAPGRRWRSRRRQLRSVL